MRSLPLQIFFFGLTSRSYLKCLAFNKKKRDNRRYTRRHTNRKNTQKIYNPNHKTKTKELSTGIVLLFYLSSSSFPFFVAIVTCLQCPKTKRRFWLKHLSCRGDTKKEGKLPTWEKWSEEQAGNITNRTRLFKKPNNGSFFCFFFSPIMWYIGYSQFFLVLWDVLSKM